MPDAVKAAQAALAQAEAKLAEHVRHRPSSSWRDTLMRNDRPWADRYFELTNDLLTARVNVVQAAELQSIERET